ncbi:MAG: MalM family protein, partial [Panacagrimonas sp.]
MNAPFALLRLTLALLLALVASGCASRASTAVTRITTPRCDAQWQLSTPQGITLDSAQGQQSHRIDPASRCLALPDGSAVSYAVFRLPRYRGPWTLQVDSELSGRSLFAPEALLLDADGKVLREVSFERFAMRGDRLQTTVFFSEENVAEHYLLLHS